MQREGTDLDLTTEQVLALVLAGLTVLTEIRQQSLIFGVPACQSLVDIQAEQDADLHLAELMVADLVGRTVPLYFKVLPLNRSPSALRPPSLRSTDPLPSFQ